MTATPTGIPPEQAGPLVHRAGILIVGELHGTQEFPRLVADIAAAAAVVGDVVVALELSADAQSRVDRYMESAGTAEDRLALLSHPAWQTKDGRTSAAVVDLIETCRRWRHQNGSMTVALVDAGRDEWAGAQEGFAVRRDELMAERLLAVSAKGSVVALLGNVHARLDGDFAVPMPTGYQPVGALVKKRRAVVSFLGAHSGGTAWCVMDRGGGPVADAHPIWGPDRGPERFLAVSEACEGYSGVAYVGPVSCSLPAARDNTGSGKPI